MPTPHRQPLVLSLSAKVSIASNAVVLLVVALLWADVAMLAPFSYNVHKALHLVGVMLMTGNLVVGPVWLALAWYSGDKEKLAWAADVVARCDIWLTAPGAQLALWNGAWMVGLLGGVHKHAWLEQSLWLLVLMAVFAVTVVLYWQEKLVAAAQAGDRQAIERPLVQWGIWGTAVSLPLGLVFWLMIAKDPLG